MCARLIFVHSSYIIIRKFSKGCISYSEEQYRARKETFTRHFRCVQYRQLHWEVFRSFPCFPPQQILTLSSSGSERVTTSQYKIVYCHWYIYCSKRSPFAVLTATSTPDTIFYSHNFHSFKSRTTVRKQESSVQLAAHIVLQDITTFRYSAW